MTDDREPYVIKAGDFDPEKHERYNIDGEWTYLANTFAPLDYLTIVRDKPDPPKPKTLEEVIDKSFIAHSFFGGAIPHLVKEIAKDLREAFPGLADK